MYREIKEYRHKLKTNFCDCDKLYVDDWTGLSEEPVQQQNQTDAAGNNGGGGSGYWEAGQAKMKKQQQQRRRKKPMVTSVETDDDVNEGDDDDGMDNGNGGGGGGLGTERQREHPFIVTEPGEVARGKKNGLDYLFHLYEQCREFLLQVQTIAKDRGEKCPTKVSFDLASKI